MQRITSVMIIFGMFALGMVFLGCGSVPPAETLKPDDTTATVHFAFPGSGVTMSGGAVTLGTSPFSLWDSDMFLSNIYGGEYLMLNMKAGTHIIIALGNNHGIIDDTVMDSSSDQWLFEVDLTPGKTYYFKITAQPGGYSALPQLKFIEPGDPVLAEYDGYMQACEKISPKGKVTGSMVKKAKKKIDALKGGSLFSKKISADQGI